MEPRRTDRAALIGPGAPVRWARLTFSAKRGTKSAAAFLPCEAFRTARQSMASAFVMLRRWARANLRED
jgi:hypothetical protein